MPFNKKILGIAPVGVFSGFENTFFNALEMQGCEVMRLPIELPFFKFLCAIRGIHSNISQWALNRDLNYNISISAFKLKSEYARSMVSKLVGNVDVIYQIGSMWNPMSDNIIKPFVLGVDYTSLLSERRGSEWRYRSKNEKEFWIDQEKKLYNRASIICSTTANAKKSIVEDYGIPAEKVIVVGAGASPPFDVQDRERYPDYRGKKILFVGKGYKGKGLDTLLEAFKIVNQEISTATLTIVGPSIKVSGKNVEYLGRINSKSVIKELYFRSSIFVLPSIFEPLGQVFLEAMSCKLPCIGTTLDGMPELIENGKTGYTIEPGNVNELASHIIYLLNNPDVSRQMGLAGNKKLNTEFTWEIVGHRIVKAMEAIIIAKGQE